MSRHACFTNGLQFKLTAELKLSMELNKFFKRNLSSIFAAYAIKKTGNALNLEIHHALEVIQDDDLFCHER